MKGGIEPGAIRVLMRSPAVKQSRARRITPRKIEGAEGPDGRDPVSDRHQTNTADRLQLAEGKRTEFVCGAGRLSHGVKVILSAH